MPPGAFPASQRQSLGAPRWFFPQRLRQTARPLSPVGNPLRASARRSLGCPFGGLPDMSLETLAACEFVFGELPACRAQLLPSSILVGGILYRYSVWGKVLTTAFVQAKELSFTGHSNIFSGETRSTLWIPPL